MTSMENLLTDHQKEIYGQFIQEDLSLGRDRKRGRHQPAGSARSDPDGVIRHLSGYEEKLHLVEKFVAIKEKVRRRSRNCWMAMRKSDADRDRERDP